MSKLVKRKELRRLAESVGATPTESRDPDSKVVMQMTLAELEKFSSALLSASKPAAPEEWKLVPVEPTEEMIQEGSDNNATSWTEDTDTGFPLQVARDIYHAMLAASPAAPAHSGEPHGYAPVNQNGNYFTKNKATADYVGGMMPVYAAPQLSQPVEAGEPKRFPAPISIRDDKICEIAGKYNLGNPRLDALRGFVNEVTIVNEAEYAKSE